MPRQGETYNRQNWAYKIADPTRGASIGTGGIFATCNGNAVTVLPGIAGAQDFDSDRRWAIPTVLSMKVKFAAMAA